MKSNFPGDIENPKKGRVTKAIQSLEKTPWREKGRLQGLCSSEKGKPSDAANGGQNRVSWAAGMMLILLQALQGQFGWFWTRIPSNQQVPDPGWWPQAQKHANVGPLCLNHVPAHVLSHSMAA